MEIKSNDATLNRPAGHRLLDAPYVFVDLPGFITQLTNENAWDKSDRNAITVFKSDNITIVLSALKAAAVIKDNTVNGFFTIQVLKGNISMETLEGNTAINEQQLITFHPGIPHSIEAKTDTILLMTTYDVKKSD